MDYKSCQVSDATLKVTGDTTLEYWGTVSVWVFQKGRAYFGGNTETVLQVDSYNEERLSKLGLRQGKMRRDLIETGKI